MIQRLNAPIPAANAGEVFIVVRIPEVGLRRFGVRGKSSGTDP
jgi:hypothetical protein